MEVEVGLESSSAEDLGLITGTHVAQRVIPSSSFQGIQCPLPASVGTRPTCCM